MLDAVVPRQGCRIRPHVKGSLRSDDFVYRHVGPLGIVVDLLEQGQRRFKLLVDHGAVRKVGVQARVDVVKLPDGRAVQHGRRRSLLEEQAASSPLVFALRLMAHREDVLDAIVGSLKTHQFRQDRRSRYEPFTVRLLECHDERAHHAENAANEGTDEGLPSVEERDEIEAVGNR